MDILASFAKGLLAVLEPANLMYCFIGVFLGTFIGVLPGIGSMAAIAMILPLSFYLEPTSALVMIAGFVIILVNLVNRLDEDDPDGSYAAHLVKAARQRLRPILLTTVTTVAGLLPMAYGIGGSDPFSAPMALAMGYGMLFATPLTLVLLPCMLAIVRDGNNVLSKLVRGRDAEPA